MPYRERQSLPTASRSRRRERGFALTEVIIASVLLVLVSGAFLQLVVGSTKAQSAMKVRQKQQAVAEGLIEHLRVDSSWTDDCAETIVQGRETQGTQPQGAGGGAGACAPIDLGAKYETAPFTKDDSTGTRYSIRATATPVDSAADGVGDQDMDHSTVDFFRVTTTVEAPEGTNVSDLTSTSTVDPFAGVVSGSVELNVCQLPMQWDDRLVVDDCKRDLDVDKGGLHPADTGIYDAIPTARKQQQVDPVPTGTVVTLQRILRSGGMGAAITGRTNADGHLALGKLAPGRYKVSVPAPNGQMSLWVAKSLPAMTLTVAPHQTTQGTIVFRYEQAPDYNIRVESFNPDVIPPDIGLGAERTVRLRLVPMPAGRAPMLEATAAAETVYDPNGGRDVTKVTIPKPYPGLYRAWVVNGKGGLERLVKYQPPAAADQQPTYPELTHIWIPPTGAADPIGIGAGGGDPQADPSAVYRVRIRDAAPPPPDYTYDNSGAPVDPPVTYPVRPPVIDGECVWHTAPNVIAALFSGEPVPGVRVCNKCPDVGVIWQQAWSSTVRIQCEAAAKCNQRVTLTNGANFLQSLLDLFGGFGLTGGSVEVTCYRGGGNALQDRCQQEGIVAGNKHSQFACLENARCDQTMQNSPSLFGTQGGAADVQCHPNATCKQDGLMAPGTIMTARCYPSATCQQSIGAGFTVNGGAGGAVTMECHPGRAGAARCVQSSRKESSFSDMLFGSQPTGPLNILCGRDSSCSQNTIIGSYSQGFNILCYSRSSCKQYLRAGAVFGFSWTPKNSRARQACFVNASCDQILVRAAPAEVLDQSCYPRDGFQRDAEAAVGPACNMTGSSTLRRYFWGLITIGRESTQDQICKTGSTCTMTITSGGGLFSNWGSRPFEQRCISRLNCTQRMTRYPALIGGGVGTVYQNCETSQGRCDQYALIYDMSWINIGPRGPYERRQVCDSRTWCKQEMYGQSGDIFATLFGTGPRNPMIQLCNRRIDPQSIIVTDPEPDGDEFTAPDPSSGGGA